MLAPALTPHAFEDLRVGMRETISRRVAAADVDEFATLSGDINPIHLNEAYAKGTRFGGRIAHGIFTAGLISAVIGTRLPGPGCIYISQNLQFKAPVMLGDVVEVTVEIADLVERGRRCTLACTCKVGDKVVLEGEAVVLVPNRETLARELAAIA